ncbi:Ig-like domain-containing protein, partial [Shewanella sp. 0m-11]
EDHHVQGDALHTVYTTGVLNVLDPDAGQDHFHSSRNVHAISDQFGGSLSIGKAGDWTYSVPNANIQHLAEGQTETVQYEVLTQGGDKQIISVTITGTNDAPELTVAQTTPTTGTLTATDVDTQDTHTFSVVSSHGQFGDLSVDPTTGAYSYNPNASITGMSYNSATNTYHGLDVFEVKVTDNHGAETSKFMTFDANGQVTSTSGNQPHVTATVPTPPLITASAPSLPTGSNTPPANAVSLDLSTTSDSGASNTDNLTNDNTPSICGTTDVPFSKVTIYDGNTPVGHALSDANGDYTANLSSLNDGTHNLSAKALAPSSLLPVFSPLLDIKVDTSTAAPNVDLAATSDSGISDHDNLTNEHTPVITGIAEANSTVTITDEHGTIVATGNADASGTYQLTTSHLAEGVHSICVAATDAAGNQSQSSLTIEVDYTAPTIAKVNLKTEADHQPTFSGSVSLDTAQVDIVVKQGSQIIETLHATLDGKGGYSVDASNLPDGVYVAYIQATDNAGNQTPSGAAGIVDRFSVDTNANAPSISFETAGSDQIYNAQEVAVGAPGTITATVALPADTNPADILTINGNSHQISNAEFLAGKVEIEVAP